MGPRRRDLNARIITTDVTDSVVADVGRIAGDEEQLVALHELITVGVPGIRTRLRRMRGIATRRLRQAGYSWEAIGDLVGVSHQRAQQFETDGKD